MTFGAQILADSLAPNGRRLTTFEMEFPRYIQAELNTHRILSKNSASSRAIPVSKMLARLQADPYYPVYWGSNKPGMQAGAELNGDDQSRCKAEWAEAMSGAMAHAEELREIGLHKQDANRILEPWMWQKVIITGTEWDNFFHLRNHPDAHPAFSTVAAMMQELYEELEPIELRAGQWHIPLVSVEEFEKSGTPGIPTLETGGVTIDEVWRYWVKVSVGRCARTSTLTHDGKRDLEADIGLHDKLLTAGHMSPFEHQARPAVLDDMETALVKLEHVVAGAVEPEHQWHGNFRGFVQYRKTIPGEFDIMGHTQ